jgi:hypothetical protein
MGSLVVIITRRAESGGMTVAVERVTQTDIPDSLITVAGTT